jgi:hypothetical protein
MHLKLPLFSQRLKLSNLKPDCRVSALHFFVKYIPLMAFRHQAHSVKCFFSFLFQNLRCVSSWKANRGLKVSRKLRTPENYHLYICSLWVQGKKKNSFDILPSEKNFTFESLLFFGNKTEIKTAHLQNEHHFHSGENLLKL